MSMFTIRTYTDEGNRTSLGMYTENHIRTSKNMCLGVDAKCISDSPQRHQYEGNRTSLGMYTKANKHVHKSAIVRNQYDSLSNI
jgi:hypothetical protein